MLVKIRFKHKEYMNNFRIYIICASLFIVQSIPAYPQDNTNKQTQSKSFSEKLKSYWTPTAKKVVGTAIGVVAVALAGTAIFIGQKQARSYLDTRRHEEEIKKSNEAIAKEVDVLITEE